LLSDKQVVEKDVFKIYDLEIGKITEAVRNAVIDAIENFTEDWVRDAILEASRANHKNWRYIEGILKNWSTKGRDVEKPAGSKCNGKGRDDPGKYFQGKYGHMVQR
jgi:DnaD/phage-associated family protein